MPMLGCVILSCYLFGIIGNTRLSSFSPHLTTCILSRGTHIHAVYSPGLLLKRMVSCICIVSVLRKNAWEQTTFTVFARLWNSSSIHLDITWCFLTTFSPEQKSPKPWPAAAVINRRETVRGRDEPQPVTGEGEEAKAGRAGGETNANRQIEGQAEGRELYRQTHEDLKWQTLMGAWKEADRRRRRDGGGNRWLISLWHTCFACYQYSVCCASVIWHDL